jgi:hypothetical protein
MRFVQRWAQALFSRFRAREREAKKRARKREEKRGRKKRKRRARKKKKREFALFPLPKVEIRFLFCLSFSVFPLCSAFPVLPVTFMPVLRRGRYKELWRRPQNWLVLL